MLTKKLILLLVLVIQVVQTGAMQIELGQYILDEGKLFTKSRFVYSDFKGLDPLKDAQISFDLGIYPLNYNHLKNDDDDKFLRLYILMTTSEDLERLDDVLQQNQGILDEQNLTYSYLFKPLKFGFNYQLDLTSDNDTQIADVDMNATNSTQKDFSVFNETNKLKFKGVQKIQKEGVYYVSFIYETIDQFKLEQEKLYEQKNYDWSNIDENIDYGEFKDGFRRQLYSNWQYKKHKGKGSQKHKGKGVPPKLQGTSAYKEKQSNNFMKQPHMIVTGNIIFKNTHGYLSAQQYDNIQINTWLLVTFTALSAIWTLALFKYWSKLLPIHYMVSIVLYACFFESMFMLMLYTSENSNIGDYTGFWIFISFMEVIRSVFSRIIVLLTALGQHITKHSVGDKYLTNIGIVSIFYAISLMIAIIMQHMKDKYQISTPIIIAGELPNLFMNILIFVWILLAFRKTLNALNESQQFQKSEIVMQMFLVYIASLFLMFSIFVYDLLGRGDPDEDWHNMALHLKSYFLVFVFLIICYSIILRPSSSKASETFNQYRNLRVDDNQEGVDTNTTQPDCAMNITTELSEVHELDKSEV